MDADPWGRDLRARRCGLAEARLSPGAQTACQGQPDRTREALSARPDVDLSRIGVAGVSMGSSTCLVLAWKEPRISVVVGLIGAVDFWYDVTKTPPGKEQDAKRDGLCLRVRQLVNSLDPWDR